jgi:hypothetical protein
MITKLKLCCRTVHGAAAPAPAKSKMQEDAASTSPNKRKAGSLNQSYRIMDFSVSFDPNFVRSTAAVVAGRDRPDGGSCALLNHAERQTNTGTQIGAPPAKLRPCEAVRRHFA